MFGRPSQQACKISKSVTSQSPARIRSKNPVLFQAWASKMDFVHIKANLFPSSD